MRNRLVLSGRSTWSWLTRNGSWVYDGALVHRLADRLDHRWRGQDLLLQVRKESVDEKKTSAVLSFDVYRSRSGIGRVTD
jgi:hypothetical protein